MEQDFKRDALTESYAEMNRLRIEEKKNKLSTEFERYKQDCRKRAIDIAVQLVSQSSGGLISDEVKKEADIYYQWLINVK